MLPRETREVRIMETPPQLGVDGELCFQWQDPTGPHLKADLWHFLPSNQLRLAGLESEVQKSLRTFCHGSGVGALVWASGPTPETPALRVVLVKDFLPFTRAQVVLSFQA